MKKLKKVFLTYISIVGALAVISGALFVFVFYSKTPAYASTLTEEQQQRITDIAKQLGHEKIDMSCERPVPLDKDVNITWNAPEHMEVEQYQIFYRVSEANRDHYEQLDVGTIYTTDTNYSYTFGDIEHLGFGGGQSLTLDIAPVSPDGTVGVLRTHARFDHVSPGMSVIDYCG